MTTLIFRKNRLITLGGKEVGRAAFVGEEQYRVANELVEGFCTRHPIASLDPRLRIAVRQLLFAYYRKYEVGLVLLRRTGTVPANERVLYQGERELASEELQGYTTLPSSFGYLGALAKSVSGRLRARPVAPLPQVPLITLGAPVHRKIWDLVAEELEVPATFAIRPTFDEPALKPGRADREWAASALSAATLPRSLTRILLPRLGAIRRYLDAARARTLVLFLEAHPTSSLIAFAASSAGMKTISLPHGTHIEEAYQHVPFDYSLVYGPSSRWTKSRPTSIKVGQVVESGAVSIDRFFTTPLHQLENDQISRVLFLSTFVVPGREHDYWAAAQALEAVVRARPDLLFTIKEHPVRINPMNRAIGRYPNVAIKRNADLLSEVDAHDVIVSVDWSNAVLEVLSRRRPHIWLNPSPCSDWYRILESGCSIEARDGRGLECALAEWDRRRLAVSAEQAKTVLDLHLAHQGRAARETARLIERIHTDADVRCSASVEPQGSE